MTELRMIICDNCRREWNTAALSRCPGCGANASGELPRSGPVTASTTPPAAVPRPRTDPAVTARLLEHARSVESLGTVVVVFAWILGVVAVAVGLLLVAAGLSARSDGSSLVATGLLIAIQGLVAAVFISLVGRYAQMRALQAQTHAGG
jgi:hypothetical protein